MLNGRDAPVTTIAATLKVLGDQVPRMATLAELLGE